MRHGCFATLALIIALVIGLLCLSGCGSANRSQRQQIADLRSAAIALPSVRDAKARQALAEAVGRAVVAATADMPELPAPTQKPENIVKDPARFIKETAAAEQSPPKYEAGPEPKSTMLHDVLTVYAKWLAIIGGGTVTLSILAFVAWLLPWTRVAVAPFLELIEDAAIGGCALLALAYSFEWLSDNLWLLGIVVLLCLAILALRLRKWWLPAAKHTLGHLFGVKVQPTVTATRP
jgi:hypothetical protein